MLLKSVQTPRGEILNVSEQEARDIFGASEDAIKAARLNNLQLELRFERNRRLKESDWTQIPDAALSKDQKTAWAKYRQILRDLPEATAETEQIIWPVEPT